MIISSVAKGHNLERKINAKLSSAIRKLATLETPKPKTTWACYSKVVTKDKVPNLTKLEIYIWKAIMQEMPILPVTWRTFTSTIDSHK